MCLTEPCILEQGPKAEAGMQRGGGEGSFYEREMMFSDGQCYTQNSKNRAMKRLPPGCMKPHRIDTAIASYNYLTKIESYEDITHYKDQHASRKGWTNRL